jgi:SAM-dependent methyltransferase
MDDTGAKARWRDVVHTSYLRSSEALGKFPSDNKHPFYLHNYGAFFPGDLNDPVLDIGIGRGDLLLLWEKLGYRNVWGIDINAEPVDVCRERFSQFHIHKVDSTSSFLKSCVGTFGLVTLFDVLEHLAKQEMFDILAAAKSALHSGGYLIVQTINAANLFQIAGRYCDITHEQSFTEVSLKQIFSLAGFTEVEIGSVETNVERSMKRRLKRYLRNVYYHGLRLAYKLDDGDSFRIMTPLIRVVAICQKGLPG